MEFQSAQIENELKNHGWSISAREICPDWWADEMWVIESVWSPIGTLAYITFIIDPQIDSPSKRKKGEQVWAVAVSASRPTGWQDGHQFLLSRGWKNHLPDFFAALAKIRD